MNSLFLKIFLWFWLATALVVAALIFVTEMTRTRRLPTAAFVAGTMAIYSQTAVKLFEKEGAPALNNYLREIDEQAQVKAAILGPDGLEIADENPVEIPAAVRTAAIAERGGDTTQMVLLSTGLYAVRRSTLTPSQSLVLFARVFEPPVGGGTISYGLRILVVLLTAGVFCYWLARYISAPVSMMRQATHQLAEGDLSVRISPSFGKRRDELAKMGRDFDQMAERIESLMSAQWRLLRDISHELRSPLTRLSIGVAIARRQAGPDNGEVFDRIDHESAQLNVMVDRLLELDRWEFGGHDYPREPVDLQDLIQEIVADAAFEAQNENRHLVVVKKEPCRVYGIPSLLRSAIENVVRNAIRHTEEGSTVEVSLVREGASGASEAVITVTDRGSGVPDSELAAIFQPFYRVDDARDRESGGTGLGLSIAERAVKLHGGSVVAQNAPGIGLNIVIRLPMEVARHSGDEFSRSNGSQTTPFVG